MQSVSTYHPAPVADAWNETASLRAVRLQLPPTLAAEHRHPGQAVKVRAGPGEAYFALSSAPDPGGRAELLVKRGGKVADAVVEAALPGGDLELTAPLGRGFPLAPALGHDVLLFAAGSGIAPIRALLQALLRRREEVDRIVLFYGQRRGDDFAYRAEHLSWERRGVRLVLCPSGEDDAWNGVRGRVSEVARTLDFGGARIPEVATYVSGMSSMVADVKETLAQAGLPAGRVHLNF